MLSSARIFRRVQFLSADAEKPLELKNAVRFSLTLMMVRSLKHLEVALVAELVLEVLGELGGDVNAWHSVFLGGDTPLAVVADGLVETDGLPLVRHDFVVVAKHWDFKRINLLFTTLDFAGVEEEFSDALLALSVALAPELFNESEDLVVAFLINLVPLVGGLEARHHRHRGDLAELGCVGGGGRRC